MSAPEPRRIILKDDPPAGPPPQIVLPRSQTTPSTAAGFYPRAVSGVMLGVTGGLVAMGAPLAARADELNLPPATAGADLAARARELESRMKNMSPEEKAAARRELWSAYAAGRTDVRDVRVILTGADAATAPSRGELAFKRAGDELERAMRVTARDMAHPETLELIDGMPGYKVIPDSEVRSILVRAIKDVPLEELPGGNLLAGLVRALPNAGNLDAEHMSYNELAKALPDAQKAWFDQQFGPFISEHKIALAVTGISTITAIRYSSPAAAGLMDRVLPSVKIWSGTAADGHLSADASVRYRDRRVLPDLDLRGTASTELRPGLSVRAGVTGTIALERDRVVSGSATVGARAGDDRRWADVSASVDDRSLVTGRLDLGLRDPESTLRASASAVGTFGRGASVGGADGRLNLELDVTKDVKVGRDATGSFGLYGSYGVDTDGRNDDARVGAVFRLRW